MSSSQESSLIRLQRTGLVGLRCNAGVVRQRQVVACHQASSARLERQSPTETRFQARPSFLRRSEKTTYGAATDPLQLHREEAHPQELRQTRERAPGSLSADDAEGIVRRLPAEGRPAAEAQARRAAGRLPVRVPDRVAQRVRRDEVHRVQHGQARVRHAGVPAARADLRRRRAREAADDHLRPRVAAGQDGQGDQGAGGLHGRGAPDDRLRLVHRQRHRARDRLAAAPFAGRVLRARQGQDALERQAAVLGADHSVPRLVARLRVRPEGHPLFPRRPPPQDAGHDPAEGDRPEPRGDPRELLRLRQLPPDGLGRAARVRRRPAARRDRALRHHRQGRQGRRREGQADHRAPRAHDRDSRARPSSASPRTT